MGATLFTKVISSSLFDGGLLAQSRLSDLRNVLNQLDNPDLLAVVGDKLLNTYCLLSRALEKSPGQFIDDISLADYRHRLGTLLITKCAPVMAIQKLKELLHKGESRTVGVLIQRLTPDHPDAESVAILLLHYCEDMSRQYEDLTDDVKYSVLDAAQALADYQPTEIHQPIMKILLAGLDLPAIQADSRRAIRLTNHVAAYKSLPALFQRALDDTPMKGYRHVLNLGVKHAVQTYAESELIQLIQRLWHPPTPLHLREAVGIALLEAIQNGAPSTPLIRRTIESHLEPTERDIFRRHGVLVLKDNVRGAMNRDESGFTKSMMENHVLQNLSALLNSLSGFSVGQEVLRHLAVISIHDALHTEFVAGSHNLKIIDRHGSNENKLPLIRLSLSDAYNDPGTIYHEVAHDVWKVLAQPRRHMFTGIIEATREKNGGSVALAGRPLEWGAYGRAQNAEEFFAETCALYLQDTAQFLKQAESEGGPSPLRHAARFLKLWVFNSATPGDLDAHPFVFQAGEIQESSTR